MKLALINLESNMINFNVMLNASLNTLSLFYNFILIGKKLMMVDIYIKYYY